MKKKWAALAAGMLGLMIAATLLIYFDLKEFGRSAGGTGEAEHVLTVPAGQPLAATAEMLQHRQLISSAFKFRMLARLEGYDRRLKAGEYILSSSMSPREILERMAKGLVRLHRLTVPEGFTISQIAVQVEKAELAPAADIVQRAKDPAYARAQGIDAPSLEGYLFPETYFFPRTVTPDGIIAAMLHAFRSAFPPEWERRAAELGFTVHEAVTLASIIEKETGDPSERSLISSVFHNRLKRGMRLETDPTVIYGIANFDGNLTRKHLETPTPFNTYIIRGLPPGPIASPGKEALKAALYPAQTDYIFFVSKNNGTHHFSTSLADHHRAVQLYQVGSGSPRQRQPHGDLRTP
jgi:UPF0755 protein